MDFTDSFTTESLENSTEVTSEPPRVIQDSECERYLNLRGTWVIMSFWDEV
jgi:hypothetical protein